MKTFFSVFSIALAAIAAIMLFLRVLFRAQRPSLLSVAVVVLFLGAVVFGYIQLGSLIERSGCLRAARDFVGSNQQIKDSFGEAMKIDWSYLGTRRLRVTGDGDGEAILTLHYEGSKGTASIAVELQKRHGDWSVVSAKPVAAANSPVTLAVWFMLLVAAVCLCLFACSCVPAFSRTIDSLLPNAWLYVRVVIVSLGGILGFMPIPPESLDQSNVDWVACAILPVAVPVMLVFVVGIQTINPFSAAVWRRPSWHINPFLLKEPLQFFHLGAFCALALGTVSVITLPFHGLSAAPLAVSFLSLGVGAWLGVKLCVRLFRKKMEPRA